MGRIILHDADRYRYFRRFGFSDFRKSIFVEIQKYGHLKIRIFGFPKIRMFRNRSSEIAENPEIRIFQEVSHASGFNIFWWLLIPWHSSDGLGARYLSSAGLGRLQISLSTLVGGLRKLQTEMEKNADSWWYSVEISLIRLRCDQIRFPSSGRFWCILFCVPFLVVFWISSECRRMSPVYRTTVTSFK